MYIARYTDKNFTSEMQWFKDNKKYAYIAKKYIPFSKKREEKIFTMAGIREHSSHSRTENTNKVTGELREATKPKENTKEGGLRNDWWIQENFVWYRFNS